MMRIRLATCLAAAALLPACDGQAPAGTAGERWYSADQVALGATLFRTHCAACHGANAEGTGDWMTRLPDGSFPPPPLDASAHAWHHSLADLQNTIRTGGAPNGGVMPAFGTTLNEAEILATIAWFQSTWPDEIYEDWALDINK